MFLTTCGTLIWILGVAQNEKNSGQVVYEETVKMEIKLEGENAQFADMMPKERKSEKVLYFTPEASLYQLNNQKKEDETVTQEVDGGAVMVKMVQPDDKFYVDLENEKTIEQRDFMSRIFLIEKDLGSEGWKITGNQKTFLGYPCQEAIKEKDSSIILAWFTPAIPVSTGPGRYTGLPGLVLSVDIDHGKRTIAAASLEIKPVEGSLIQKPKGGKKVSPEEFDRIVAEKQKEMQEQYGGSGGVVIRIQQ